MTVTRRGFTSNDARCTLCPGVMILWADRAKHTTHLTKEVVEPPVVVDPPVVNTPPSPMPVKGQAVKIGSNTRLVDGQNVPRLSNQLVAYTTSPTTTNQYGVEVVVLGGKVSSVNDRVTANSTTGTVFPTGAYVLSGHDLSGDWLRNNASVGASVSVVDAPVPPIDITTPAVETPPVTPVGTEPMPYPVHPISGYYMMWPNISPRLADVLTAFPAINDIRLSFLQAGGIVGWSTQGEQSFIADAKMLRSKGVRILLSVGGAGGAINLSAREGFVSQVMAINAKIPLDGLDWDVEGAAMGPADVAWICTRLKALRGKNFAITMAPNGSNIGEYLGIAKALHAQNLLDAFGQQFYDAPVSEGAMMGRVDEYVAAGLPVSKYQVGCMTGTDASHWTVDTCVSRIRAVKAKYPALGGAYLWQVAVPTTSEWAKRVSAIFQE